MWDPGGSVMTDAGSRPSGYLERQNSITSLAALDLSEQSIDTVLGEIGRIATSLLDGWDYAAGSIAEGDVVASYGVTDERVNAVDQAQYDAGAGPCLDSLRKGRSEYFDGTPKEGWQHFAEVAAAHGVRSVLSFPMRVGEHTIGALNFYSTEAEALQPGQREEGFAYAANAAVVLSNVKQLAETKHEVAQLEEGLKTRTMIGQATGLLMAQEGLTSEEAFAKLVKVSQAANIKLRDIAQRYVDSWEESVNEGQDSASG
jgi:transcriptional regulator with GAF, ATPase, and Fis domain